MTMVPWAAHVGFAHEDVQRRILGLFRRAPWKDNQPGQRHCPDWQVAGGDSMCALFYSTRTNFDRPERIDILDVLPPLEAAAQKPSGGSRKLAYFMRSLVCWMGDVHGDF